MELLNKEPKNRFGIDKKMIFSLLIGLGFLSAILLAAMLSGSGNLNNKVNGDGKANQYKNNSETAAPAGSDGILLAIVKDVDTENNQITLFDINRQEAVALSYNGGTNITDKYGKIISMSQITKGIMVDAYYQQGKNKLTDMNISKKAWEYPGVNNMSINLSDKIMKIAFQKYKYTDNICVFNGQEFIPVDQLAEQDVLTVWGYEEMIWSVVVTKGHGLVKLRDYEDYIGNSITIGYEAMQQITEDMEITVREGTYNLTVENGRYSATKSVTINRNEVNYVSLSDLGPDGLKVGYITFTVSPADADLYIDKELMTYSDPIELTYGEHMVKASLGGYASYEGVIDVDSKSKLIKINLPEAKSSEEAAATETDTSTGVGMGENNSSPVDKNTGSTVSEDTSNTDTGNQIEDNSDASDDSLEKKDIEIDKAHKISVKKPSGASVYLDGDFVGVAPCDFTKIIGSHVLTFIKDGYKTTSYTVEVKNDGTDPEFSFPDLSSLED